MALQPDLVGQTLGGYRIIEQVGRGGMAIVYKAYEPALDRYVAIKVLPQYFAHDPDFQARFEREAKAVARLNHPNILPIYGVGQDAGLNYIVMRYVEAGTLKEMLGKPLDLTTAAAILGQISRALDYAHQRGIVHRDVKPSNVLMAEDNWVLLTDFGLARMVESSVQLTKSGVGVGTPAYMSPEQGQGLKVDARSDVYSLGVLLYEMVTGKVPYNADTPMAIVIQHISAPLPLPRKLNPDLPEAVERVILKALAKSPDDRYQTAAEMFQALEQAAAKAPTATMPAPAERVPAEDAPTEVLAKPAPSPAAVPVAAAPPAWKRLPVWVWGAVGAVGLLIVVVGVLLATSGGEPAPALARDATPTALARATSPPRVSDTPGLAPPTAAASPAAISWEEPSEGKYVFICEDVTPHQICVHDVLTDQESQVTDDLDFKVYGAASWSPDGQQIGFSAAPSDDEPQKLYVINADGSGLRQITSGGTYDHELAWSPDGEWIAFQRDCDLWLVRPDGSDARALVESADHYCIEAPAWSPDSQWIAFLNFRESTGREIRIVHRDGNDQHTVHTFERPPSGGAMIWSPDGRQIISLYSVGGEEEKLLVNADGSGEPQPIEEMPWAWFPNFWPQWGIERETVTGPAGVGEEYFEKGMSLLDRGEYGQAIEQFDQALGVGWETAELFHARGWACHEWQFFEGGCSYEQALEDLNRAIAMDPQVAHYFSARAATYMDLDQPELALADATRAIELDPNNAGFWVDRGWARRALGDPEAALADFSRAIELGAREAGVYSARAGTYIDLGQPELALADATRATELDPQNAGFWVDRGWAHQALGDHRAALADFDRAIELDPQNPHVFSARAAAHMDLHELEQALADYTTAIELDPELSGFWVDRGWVYQMLGDFEAALANFDRAIELDPQNARAYHGRGTIYQDMNELDMALADFATAIELEPEDPEGYLKRGWAYRLKGDYGAAIEDLNEAIRLDPRSPWGYIDRGSIFDEDLGRGDEALDNFNRAVEVAPEDPNPYFHRAMYFQRRSEWEAVITDLTQAIPLAPEWPDLYGHRGGAFAELGLLDEAHADFERFLELTQANPEYDDWRAGVEEWLRQHQ